MTDKNTPNGTGPEDDENFADKAVDAVKDAASEAVEQAEGGLSKLWNSKAMSPIRVPYKIVRAVTAPVWWPMKKLTQGLFHVNKPLGIAFGLAAAGAVATAGFYGSALGVVKFYDTTSFMNWPATQGQWKGNITRFSKKGSLICQSYEGNLRTGEAADSQEFAVRIFNEELITGIKEAMSSSRDVTLVFRDNGLGQDAFGTVVATHGSNIDNLVDATPWIGCIQHYSHTAVGVQYTNAQGGVVTVGIAPNNLQ